MDKIKREKEAARNKFRFAYIDEQQKLVALTLDNVALVEAMICTDSKYLKSGDKNLGPNGKYPGSTAYWMTELKKYYDLGKTDEVEYKRIIENAVAAVDRENSTHLNTDSGRGIISQRIIAFGKDKILNSLRKPSFEFFEEIARKTSDKKGARKNISFASKFCHYACMYLFEGKPEQDNFSKYDNVVKTVIPQYAEYYKLEYEDLKDYKNYSDLIERILQESGNQISKNGFDHLLWYYYKGRLSGIGNDL